MTQPDDELQIEQKVVVVFDICSSSNILEDLIVRQDLRPMRDLLIEVKQFLRKKAAVLAFDPYKFIGDGWIILFPTNVSGRDLVHFLEELSSFFSRKLKRIVIPHLEHVPSILGLTFGVDVGPLVRMRMMGKPEYLGRPINVATRLQSGIKDKDDNPAYKVLFSKPAFNRLRLTTDFRKTMPATRKLRNIRNSRRFACMKVWLKT
jgi:class 3 adenylate cyclase